VQSQYAFIVLYTLFQQLCGPLADYNAGNHGVARCHPRHDRPIRNPKLVDSGLLPGDQFSRRGRWGERKRPHHGEELKQKPSEWMPWNYRDTLARLATSEAA
jgi:hypothetical protein